MTKLVRRRSVAFWKISIYSAGLHGTEALFWKPKMYGVRKTAVSESMDEKWCAFFWLGIGALVEWKILRRIEIDSP